MTLNKKLLAVALVVPAVALGGIAIASATPGQSGAKSCSVSVDRSQAAGTFNVTRQVMQNGDCMCYVYAGPKGAAKVERAISSVVQSRKCSGSAGLADYAAGAQDTAPAPADAAAPAAGGASSGSGVVLGVVAAAAVAGGVVAVATSDDSSGG